jgi:YD repeat-containing protein
LADSAANYHVTLQRFYNSVAPDAYAALSPRWGFGTGPDLRVSAEDGSVTVLGPSGWELTFLPRGDGTFIGPANDQLVLASLAGGGWRLTRTTTGEAFGFDALGRHITTQDAAGRTFTVQDTSAAGRSVLGSYGTSDGRRANLSYTGDPLVRLMDDPMSGHHSYGYTAGRLTQYLAASGARTAYHYDISGRVDAVTAADGSTAAATLLPDGRVSAISITGAGGPSQTTRFDYGVTGQTTVTAPDSRRRTYVYDEDYRVLRDFDSDGQAVRDDTTPPEIELAGALYDARDDLDGGGWTLEVHAEDGEAGSPGSGVAGISVKVDDPHDPFADEQPQDMCSESSNCALDGDFTIDADDLAEGDHELRVVVTDFAGNRSTRTLTIHTSVAPDEPEPQAAARGAARTNPCPSDPGYDVYYAGNAVDSLPATFAQRTCQDGTSGPAHHDTTYVYGACEATAGAGCAAPLVVNSAPVCERHASAYSDPSGQVLAHVDGTLRGGTTASFDDGRTLELYTGSTTITVTASTAALATRAAAAVRVAPAAIVPAQNGTLDEPVASDPGSPAEHLPPADPADLAESATC